MTNSIVRLVILGFLTCGVGCEADPGASNAPPEKQPTGSEPSPDARIDVPSGQPDASSTDTSEAAASDAATSVPDTSTDAFSGPVTDVQGSQDSTPRAGWQLAWSDEFNGVVGTKPDPTKWVYDLGAGG
jgi:hypothetical protein